MPATTKHTVNNTVLLALARLATATADYETAWRRQVAREHGAFDDMYGARRAQEAARDTLIGVGLDPKLVFALEGALVVAAARPKGDRPKEHRDGDAHGQYPDVAQFLRETMDAGGIV
jgi:hypothetical protein